MESCSKLSQKMGFQQCKNHAYQISPARKVDFINMNLDLQATVLFCSSKTDGFSVTKGVDSERKPDLFSEALYGE
jgi:hypothetical protein